VVQQNQGYNKTPWKTNKGVNFNDSRNLQQEANKMGKKGRPAELKNKIKKDPGSK
jgi:hypothetical protein